MSTLTIELPAQEEQIAFNLRRWEEILRDPGLAKIEGGEGDDDEADEDEVNGRKQSFILRI